MDEARKKDLIEFYNYCDSLTEKKFLKALKLAKKCIKEYNGEIDSGIAFCLSHPEICARVLIKCKKEILSIINE